MKRVIGQKRAKTKIRVSTPSQKIESEVLVQEIEPESSIIQIPDKKEPVIVKTDIQVLEEKPIPQKTTLSSFEELSDNHTLIPILFNGIINCQKRDEIISKMDELYSTCELLAVDLDLIGFGGCSKKLRGNIKVKIKRLNKKLKDKNIKPKQFQEEMTSLKEEFLALNTKEPKEDTTSVFDVIPEMFNVKDIEVVLSTKSAAEVISCPLFINFTKAIAPRTKSLLSQLGAIFAPYTGAMMWKNAKFLLLNKRLFNITYSFKELASGILSNISNTTRANISLIAINDISLEDETFYLTLVVPEAYSRVMCSVLNTSNKVHIYFKVKNPNG